MVGRKSHAGLLSYLDESLSHHDLLKVVLEVLVQEHGSVGLGSELPSQHLVVKDTQPSLVLAQVDLGVLNIVEHVLVALFIHDVVFVCVDCLAPPTTFPLLLGTHLLRPHLQALGNLFVEVRVFVRIAEVSLHQRLSGQAFVKLFDALEMVDWSLILIPRWLSLV